MQKHPKKMIKKARKIINTLLDKGLSKAEARSTGIKLYKSIAKVAEGGQ